MKRITFSVICVLTFIGIALSASLATADDKDRDGNATVSFGQWDPNDPDLNGDPTAIPPVDNRFPLDRLVNDPSGGRGNNHQMLPKVVKIKEGDSVSFIISGGHILAVYDDGTKPKEISLDIETPCDVPTPSLILTACSPQSGSPPAPTAGGILSQSTGRIYRGQFLNVNPARRDGAEVVQFTKPGTYLVICARKNHFFNPVTQEFEMFGFVKVEKDRNKRW
jgi:hypothetical protein